MTTQTDRFTWLWLLIGILLLPFVMVQTVIPLAAWLAPIFLLRFVRTSKRALVALPLIFVAYAVGVAIATRGGDLSNPQLVLPGIILFPLIRGVMYTLPYAADRLIGPRLGQWPRVWVFPAAYTTVEWVMSLAPLVNTTGFLAYSQYDNLALMQILSITGMWGLTFLITWCASTVNALWEHNFNWRPVRNMVVLLGAVLLAAFLFGSARLNFAPPPSQTVEAATIISDSTVEQAATSPVDWLTISQATDAQRAAARPGFEATINLMLARTEAALRSGAKIVTWEEGSGIVLEEDKSATLDRVAALAKQYGAYLQVSLGVVTRIPNQHFIRNQSILVDPSGSVLWTYDKTYLVFPGEWYLMIAGPGVLPVTDTPYGRMTTAICNDMHFLPLIRQAGQQGADIMLTPYHDVHPFESEDAVVATYRAIENGFSIVRPTGAGLSTIVDYEGRVLASESYLANPSGIMLANVPIQGVRTIYSVIGDSFAYLCVFGVIFLLGWAILRRRQQATAGVSSGLPQPG